MALGTIDTNQIASEAVTVPKVIDQVLTNRNLIINGAMNLAQRSTSASGIGGTNSGTYNAQDRWNFFAYGSPAARWTQSVSTDVPASSTFTTSLKLDCTTASGTVGAAHRQQLMQVIEAQDLQHLRYGSSAAKKITVSFWVKSSVTGKNYCWVYHNDGGRFTYKSYTVNSADTWEHKALTFTGDTASAITNDSGAGLNIIWMLYVGTDYSGATDGVEDTWQSWSAGNYDQFHGQVNNASSTSNNWYLTGTQVEVGDSDTPFEHEHHSVTLAKCQRYYQEYVSYKLYFNGTNEPSSEVGNSRLLPVVMRAVPAVGNKTSTHGSVGAYSANTHSIRYITVSSHGSGGFDVGFDLDAEF